MSDGTPSALDLLVKRRMAATADANTALTPAQTVEMLLSEGNLFRYPSPEGSEPMLVAKGQAIALLKNIGVEVELVGGRNNVKMDSLAKVLGGDEKAKDVLARSLPQNFSLTVRRAANMLSGGGGNYRDQDADAPQSGNAGAKLLEELRKAKFDKVNGKMDFSPEQVLGKLRTKGLLTQVRGPQEYYSVTEKAMQDVIDDTLRIKPADTIEGRQAYREEDILNSARMIPSREWLALTDNRKISASASDALQRAQTDRLVNIGYLQREPSLTKPALYSFKSNEMQEIVDGLGIPPNRESGRLIVDENSLMGKLKENPKAFHAVLAEPAELTARDVVEGLVDRHLLYRISYRETPAGTPHELRVGSEQAVQALESVGINVDFRPGGGRVIQRESILKSFGGSDSSLNKAFAHADLLLRSQNSSDIAR